MQRSGFDCVCIRPDGNQMNACIDIDIFRPVDLMELHLWDMWKTDAYRKAGLLCGIPHGRGSMLTAFGERKWIMEHVAKLYYQDIIC